MTQLLPDVSRLRHNALLYDSADAYLATAVGFLKEGLEAGEGAVVAHTRPGLALVREALGTDADQVTFVDVSAAYTRPARTLAAYHAVYAQQLRSVPAVRAVADVQVGPDLGGRDTWTLYEAAFNSSFAHLPAWVLCSYDAAALPDETIEAVWRTHPEVVSDGGWTVSPRYEDPAQLLADIAAPGPAVLDGLRPVPLRAEAEERREGLARELVAEGVPPAKALDMLVAAEEVLANADRHGGGVAAVRVGRVDGRLVCEVVDHGPGFDDPLAGYRAPRAGLGAGLWVARQLTWQLDFVRAPSGFTTRITL